MLAIPDNSVFPSWFCSRLSVYLHGVKPWAFRKEIEHPAWQMEKVQQMHSASTNLMKQIIAGFIKNNFEMCTCAKAIVSKALIYRSN